MLAVGSLIYVGCAAAFFAWADRRAPLAEDVIVQEAHSSSAEVFHLFDEQVIEDRKAA